MTLEGGSGRTERVLKSDLICWHFASKTRRKGGRLQNAVQTFYDSCSPVFVVFVVCALSYCRSAPFFFLIVLDDLGWSDVGFHGSQINTTNMDKLVSEGVILDNYSVQTICSPTRGALLTGMYPTHTVKKSLRNYAQHLYLHYFNWIGCLYSQWCHRSSLVMFSKVSIPPLNSFLWFTDNFFATSGINKWFILVSQDNLFKDESTRIRNWSPALPYGSPNLSDQ